MAHEITDQDIKIAIERAHQFRAEAAADFGRGLKTAARKLIGKAAQAVHFNFAPSKPQH